MGTRFETRSRDVLHLCLGIHQFSTFQEQGHLKGQAIFPGLALACSDCAMLICAWKYFNFGTCLHLIIRKIKKGHECRWHE